MLYRKSIMWVLTIILLLVIKSCEFLSYSWCYCTVFVSLSDHTRWSAKRCPNTYNSKLSSQVLMLYKSSALFITLTGKSVKLSVLILAPRQNKLVTGTVYPSIIKNIKNVTTRWMEVPIHLLGYQGTKTILFSQLNLSEGFS